MITLKLFDTYGPRDPRNKLVNLLLKTARDGTSLSMSPGEQYIDIVHVDDVVAAYLTAAERLQDGLVKKNESYGVASGKPIRLRDLVDLIGRVSGSRINVDWGGRPYRPREVMQQWSGYRPLPNWVPRITLAAGLRDLWLETRQI